MFKKIFITACIISALLLMSLGIYDNSRGILYSDGKKSALPKIHFEVSILPDGSSRVDEYRTYHFIKGEFSRGFLEIDGKISDVTVSENNMPYKKTEKFDKSRPQGFYAVDEKSSPARIEWYYLAKDNETRTFKISYTVRETATLYNDCVDYFHKYLSSKNAYKIKDFSVLLHLPQGSDKGNTKIWAHGPVGGNVDFSGNTDVMLSMKNVPKNKYIEARILMPAEVLPGCEKKVNTDRYKELLERENTASAKSDRKRILNGIFSILCILVSIVFILLPIILRISYLKRLKRCTPQMAPPYYRDLPSNILPAELDYLMTHIKGKKDTSKQMSATILDLIYRDIIKAEIIEKQGLLRNKKDTSLILNTSDNDKLAAYEKTLLDFLFGIVGNGAGSVTLKQVKNFCSNKKYAQAAYRSYSDFESKVYNKVRGRKYFETEKNELPKWFGVLIPAYIVMMILPMVLMNAAGFLKSSPIYIISIGSFAGFMVFVLFGPKKKNMLTQKGEDQLALWQAFKAFLSDFTAFDEKELPELFMWEKYLVYATVLGVAEKLLKQLFMRYPELMDEQHLQNTSLLYALDMHSFNEAAGSLELIGQSISDAMSSAANIAAKSASQGSGGGFSSGGSDSGGGAGGSSGGVD